MLTLVLLLLSQTPQHRLFLQPNLPSAPDVAFFEAFPANGAGTSGACSTTAPTGAKGEALTFARTSAATCTKTATGGLATSGIANGDLVVMASNQPRVEYDSNGVLGLLVESSRTNSCLRSQELDNAAWTLAAVSAVVPVRTADAATQPDGTVTAERLDFPAVSAGGAYSVVYQGVTGTAAAWTATCYAKGVSGSGTIYMMLTPGGSYTSAACNYTSTSWTRCSVTATETAAAWFLQIGVDLRDGTQTSKSAQSVYVTDCQWEAGAYATSYIPTTSAAVTRSAEDANFNGTSWPTATYSVAASATRMANTNGAVLDGVTTGNAGLLLFSGLRQRHLPGPSDVAGAVSFTANVSSRFASSFTGTTGQVFQDGVSLAGPTATTAPGGSWSNTVRVGYWVAAASWSDGIYSRVCLDPNPTRCR